MRLDCICNIEKAIQDCKNIDENIDIQNIEEISIRPYRGFVEICDYLEKKGNEIIRAIKQLERNKDIENICNECSSIVKEVGFTKEDLDRIVAETRETQRKAEKYDLLVEKLEEDVKTEREFMKGLIYNSRAFHYANGRETKVQEILSFMEEK